jgi:hypothetical protein
MEFSPHNLGLLTRDLMNIDVMRFDQHSKLT